MKCKAWGGITPQEVSEVVSFERIVDGSEGAWCYSASDSMYDIQAEGTARLWNLLDTERLALLADEVGMGKTIQALAVCALLWRLYPHARVLVMAPNHSVVENWVNEYTTFINSHIRKSDNLVRTGLGMHAVHQPFLCGNFAELEDLASSGWCHFIIAKTSSLSASSTKPGDEYHVRTRAAYRDGAALNRHITESLGGKIDLLIIDEAQYYRKFDGSSLRVHTARGFFGAPPPEEASDEKLSRPLAWRTLLMTATPNHTANDDVRGLIKYFNPGIAELESPDILERIGVRRLRRLQGKSKYQYRDEQDLECTFRDNLLGELFFALYQRKLATEVAGDASERRSFTYGYLEGFESAPLSDTPGQDVQEEASGETEGENPEADEGGRYEDFRTSKADSELLQELARDYRDMFNDEFPVHPKYSAITDRLSVFSDSFWSADRDSTNDKNLIFVRRIPSVRELAARINRNYDELFMKKIYGSWGDFGKTGIPNRAEYNAYVAGRLGRAVSEDDEEPEDAAVEEEESEESESLDLNSRVLDLFRVKKDMRRDLQRTHASNFRLRFNRDPDPFSVFFLPPPDYVRAPYTDVFREKRGERVRYLYESSAHYQRLGDHHENPERSTILQHLQKIASVAGMETEKVELHTLWGLFYPLLDRNQKEILDNMDVFGKEGFARYLQKGILFASASLIELYGWFIEAQLSGAARGEIYDAFIEKVRNNLVGSLLIVTIRRAIEQFDIYVEKICGLYDRLDLLDERWSIFNRQNPAYPCSGDTKNRQRLINAFNSPFFPNVLISTSVLQEGVNLQYNCRNVYHYGIAWTPGDNEQRVGRIDRLFSLVERDIKENTEGATLNIYYPYLADSFDRDQVAEFIKKKYENERTLDKCYIPHFNKVISDASSYAPYWKEYFRKPVPDAKVEDPYSAKKAPDALNHTCRYTDRIADYPTAEGLEQDILQKISRIVYGTYDKGTSVLKTRELRTQIALIDVILENNRHQPVVAEINFSSELSGLIEGTVYYLTFRSPLTSDDSKRNIRKIREMYERHRKKYPLVQLCHQSSAKSRFTLYMRTDIPLLVRKKGRRNNVSDLEISSMFTQLAEFTDLVEQSVFGDEQDITLLHVKDEERHETVKIDRRRGPKPKMHVSEQAVLIDRTRLHNRTNRSRGYKHFSAMQLTHEFQFVSFRETDTYLVLELYYPEGDLDRDEEELLKRWFGYVKGMVGDG